MKKLIYMIAAAAVAIPVVALAQGRTWLKPKST